jgi:ribonuclease D
MMLITDQQSLAQHCEQFATRPWLALDTEFTRDKSYYPKLCLLQLSDGKQTIVIDTLVELDWTPLIALLTNPNIIKVIHAARQDIEAVFVKFKCQMQPIFDSQIAALFLGFKEAPGFESLTKRYLNLTVDKRLQFSKWDKRPLAAEYYEYAYNDATLLAKVYLKLQAELLKTNKLRFANAECADLGKDSNFYPSELELLQKFTSIFKRKKQLLKCLNILRQREAFAQVHDIARSHVLSNHEITRHVNHPKASSYSGNNDFLLQLNHNFIASDHDMELVETALKSHIVEVNYSKDLIEALKSLARQVAFYTGISSQILVTTDELIKFVLGKPCKITETWRYRVYGRYAAKIASGKAFIGFKNGQMLLLEKFAIILTKSIDLKNELDSEIKNGTD